MSLEKKVLAVSQKAVRRFLTAGTLDIGVAELSRASGISPRTFHRYFPTKPQVIRPFFDEITRRFGEILMDPGLEFPDAARAAFRTEVLGSIPGEMVEFMRLLHTRKEYWSVFLEVADASETEHSLSLRRRVPGLSDTELIVLTAGVVSSSRLALITAFDGSDPEAAFADYLHLFTAGLTERL